MINWFRRRKRACRLRAAQQPPPEDDNGEDRVILPNFLYGVGVWEFTLAATDTLGKFKTMKAAGLLRWNGVAYFVVDPDRGLAPVVVPAANVLCVREFDESPKV